MTINRRALLAAALVSIPVLAGGTSFWAYRTCHVPVGRAAIKATNSIGCFEFWLNRYQQLIAGILALVAAGVAAWLVWRQLRVMDVSRAVQVQEIAAKRMLATRSRPSR
jgi:hypothetical protein